MPDEEKYLVRFVQCSYTKYKELHPDIYDNEEPKDDEDSSSDTNNIQEE